MLGRIFLALPLTIYACGARAADITGPAALALGGIVAAADPTSDRLSRLKIADLFSGKSVGGGPFVVKAVSIHCRQSNVAIEARDCTLTFPSQVTLVGRPANELFATMALAGVPGDAGAGTMSEALKTLACRLDPGAIADQDGSGAKCTYEPGP
jgi:hypothetical protein